MEKSFTSLAELQTEIQVLKVRNFQQEEVIKEKLSSPSAIFHTVTSLFKSGHSSSQSVSKTLLNQDLFTNLARVGIPLIMNGFLFKKSGFVAKMLITFLSQKAAKQVTSNTVTGLVDKVQGLFKKFMPAAKKKSPIRDYGIPPDSESY